MAEKKRKRQENDSDSQPKKKKATERPAQLIKVTHIESEEWTPVLASTPGLSLPKNISFQPYKNANELLLHSSQHPRVDYTAREEAPGGFENHLKHYIGIFDPERKELKLIPCKKLVTRSTIRRDDSDNDSSQEEAHPVTGYAARNRLGLAFGTKKSKKAIKNLTVNAISASPAKPKSNPDDEDKPKKLDAMSEAVISSMPAHDSMPTREDMQTQVDKQKPIPTPHLNAQAPADVYPVTELVGGEQVLRKLHVKEWIDKLKSGQDVQTRVKFVALRLVKVANSDDVLKMRVLKYLCLLVGWWHQLKRGRIWRVPKLEEMKFLGEFGTDLVEGLKTRFSRDGDGIMTKWHQQKVLSHILALTLVVDDFNTDVTNIQNDLKIPPKDLKSLFKELGCPLRRPTDAERKQLNLPKNEADLRLHAQLKLPLTFPKPRLPVKRRR